MESGTHAGERRIERPTDGATKRIAIIGAGLSGLVAGRLLQGAGHEIRIFDKGRRPGGRLSTRQVRGESFFFDHGAQYFTARSESFRRAVATWVERGALELWPGRLVEIHGPTGERREKGAGERFVGQPSMQSLAAHLARGLSVDCGHQVTAIDHDGSLFNLALADGTHLGSFDGLLLTAPSAQTAKLLEGVAPDLASRIRDVEMLPCWAVMAAFREPLFENKDGFDGAFIDASPLSWAARDTSKPGRPSEGAETWVLHASADWSASHLEDSQEDVAENLLAAFFAACGLPGTTPMHLIAHRWLYARPAAPVGEIFWDAALRLGAGGDWSLDARVEGAFLAGEALAGRFLAPLDTESAL